ncbi:MAG: glycosyltransferase family 2 protein [Chloroflexaceae bacterium]|nr:glycosyltransferase family 2 protein [Chloroflexaceae bacterium]NJO06809.1 glycosyltransferase family 2 protein [Chloroflexaceae bacterium]
MSAAKPDSPLLSIVIPAYNEARRLPRTLSIIKEYIARQPFVIELLVADDGSSDTTAQIATAAGTRVLHLDHRGKGFAVRAGALAACGDYILLCDADLATPIEEWEKLWPHLQHGAAVVIGSREGIGAQRIGEPWYRHVMGRVFNFLVHIIALRGIQDTQCGFKAMRHDVAHDLFNRVRIYGENARPVQGAAVTAYDVELLFLAQQCGYSIVEVPVVWHYGEETKVDPLRDSLRNLRDVIQVRLNAWRGLYRNPVPPHSQRSRMG